MQAALFQALAQVASKEALQPILAGYQSPDENLRKQTLKLIGSWKNNNGLPDMLILAEDDALPLTDHVVIMRGITRLLAAQGHQERREDQVIQALEWQQDQPALWLLSSYQSRDQLRHRQHFP